jgi:dTDP-glucose 4,6-dehydratase
MKNILITGGAGFIGSHVIRRFVNKYPNFHIYNLDALTYAGNLENLKDVQACSNYTFLHGDITNEDYINSIFGKYKFQIDIPNWKDSLIVCLQRLNVQKQSNA